MPDNIWERDDGVYFGYQCEPPDDPDNPLDGIWKTKPHFNLYSREPHIVTIGPNGSGKTRRLLIPNLHRLRNWSIVAIDPKGELAALTAAYRAGYEGGPREDRVVVIDPFGVVEQNYPRLVERYPFLKSRGYNPVAALDPAGTDFEDDAKKLAEALIKIDEKGERHWAESAQALVKGLLLAMRLRLGDASLEDLRDILGSRPETLAKAITGSKDEGFDGWVTEFGEKFPAIPATLNRFSRIGDDNRELLSILSNALTQTDWIDSRPIRADLKKGSFDFSILKRRPTTIYLVLPPRYLATHATWLRLMVTSILIPLLRSVDDAKVPVLFMLDEFAQMGHMKVIEDNLALMRAFGVKLWVVFQDLAQAEDLYAKRWESFIGNAGVVQAFAPQDVLTRKYLSELSGQRLYWLKSLSRSESRSSGQQSSRGESTQEQFQHLQGPVYWPQGLGLMETGQSVLFTRGRLRRTVLPDPSELPGAQEMLKRAYQEIGTR